MAADSFGMSQDFIEKQQAKRQAEMEMKNAPAPVPTPSPVQNAVPSPVAPVQPVAPTPEPVPATPTSEPVTGTGATAPAPAIPVQPTQDSFGTSDAFIKQQQDKRKAEEAAKAAQAAQETPVVTKPVSTAPTTMPKQEAAVDYNA